MFFQKFKNKIFFKLVGSILNMERINTRKKEYNQQFSVQSVMLTFILIKYHRFIHNSIDFYLFIML